MILDKNGDNLLSIIDNEYEGRAAFFDLFIDGHWGGVISGKASIDFSHCACGARGPSIRDDIVRYADLKGDNKIGCAGTIGPYVRRERKLEKVVAPPPPGGNSTSARNPAKWDSINPPTSTSQACRNSVEPQTIISEAPK